MSFWETVKFCFANYATVRGRAPRSEYWYFFLFTFIGSIIAMTLDAAFFAGSNAPPLNAVFALATIIPHIAVGVRRLHDTGRAGWWLLLFFVPLIGTIVLLVWFCSRGTVGPNAYGSDVVSPPPVI